MLLWKNHTVFYPLDGSCLDDILPGQNINNSDLKKVHAKQNKELVGRLRSDSDWTTLYKSWRNIHNRGAKQQKGGGLFYLLEKSSKILAYAILHFDEGNPYAKVPVIWYKIFRSLLI